MLCPPGQQVQPSMYALCVQLCYLFPGLHLGCFQTCGVQKEGCRAAGPVWEAGKAEGRNWRKLGQCGVTMACRERRLGRGGWAAAGMVQCEGGGGWWAEGYTNNETSWGLAYGLGQPQRGRTAALQRDRQWDKNRERAGGRAAALRGNNR